MRKKVVILLFCLMLPVSLMFPVSLKAAENQKVTAVIPCEDSDLTIDAEVICSTDRVCAGEASLIPFDARDSVTLLYGQEENWRECPEPDDGMWTYDLAGTGGQNQIFGSVLRADEETGTEDGAGISFEISPLNESYESLLDMARPDAPEAILELLEIDGKAREIQSAGNEVYYAVTGELEGVPVAWKSEAYAKGTMCYRDERLTYLNYTGRYQIEDRAEATLLSMDEILEHVQSYAAAGAVHPAPSGDAVTEIELQYYLDREEGSVTFRPVWVFKTEELIEGMVSPTGGSAELFYVDAQSGELVEYMGV